MNIHKEGNQILGITALILTALILTVSNLAPTFTWIACILAAVLFLSILQFFRNPHRPVPDLDDSLVYAPADGKVVVVEETLETEYFQEPRIQISIFMSPTDVHVNRNPISGIIQYFKYHPGKYLVAWHPKSSTENERTTVVIANSYAEILLRQIAGAMARRIVYYIEEGEKVQQGKDLGFIKFGSRVDVLLPLDAEVLVEIGQIVKGNKTILAKLKATDA